MDNLIENSEYPTSANVNWRKIISFTGNYLNVQIVDCSQRRVVIHSHSFDGLQNYNQDLAFNAKLEKWDSICTVYSIRRWEAVSPFYYFNSDFLKEVYNYKLDLLLYNTKLRHVLWFSFIQSVLFQSFSFPWSTMSWTY